MHDYNTKNILLSSKPVSGIIRIYNIHSDKSLLLESLDISDDIQAIRFKLDLGVYPNQELQGEYEDIGLELFSLEPWKIKEGNYPLHLLFLESLKELQDKGIVLYQN
ncbi:hypothetical protein SpiGrapes_0340 [Sphaerochaeta pleomorpha str. Grapes]|uniref:Uncharacterized protein n=1 Tax=Sphaerochaeta pleomorpha (strain ATCC BAA-1885 / DSM 22778 / Grapes) TaxID=158190 RepID=G8QVG5_SPHPG|nr:hypothetical protein [Sphaerochaeta pleomorpha]AEV28198.1 hypothetical protein SpiGrapes_0340 [Sphaerochaeta pleomorpha str. Grapes]